MDKLHKIELPVELRAKLNSNLVNWRLAQSNQDPEKRIPDYATFVDRLFKQLDLIPVDKVREALMLIFEGHLTVEQARTALDTQFSPDWSMMHAAVGFSGEGGELLDAVKKVCIYGKDWNQVDAKTGRTPLEGVVEELHDAHFYMKKIMNMIGITYEDLEACSHSKLSVRYASGRYSDAQAQQRADKVVDDSLTVAPQQPVPPPVGLTDHLPTPLGARNPDAPPVERSFMGNPAAAKVVDDMAAQRETAMTHNASWNKFMDDALAKMRKQFEELPLEDQQKLVGGKWDVNASLKRVA